MPPAPAARINDYAGALKPEERESLERRLAGRESGTSNQVAVAIFRSLEGESVEDFSIRLAQAWRIGGRGTDNGVIFLIFLQERKTRIEVGYGLEANLTDAVSSSILRDVVAPRFREGKLADGIGAGVDAIQAAVAGQYRIPSSGQGAQGRRGAGSLALPLVVGIIAVAVIASMAQNAHSARIRRNGWTGGSRGWGGPMIGGGPWIGGGGWSGGGGGGAGGGFSGGGGSFGGGGASGEW